MSPAPTIEEIDALGDAEPSLHYVRRIRPSDVVANADTGEVEILPQKAFVFDPDLSIHQVAIIEALKSTVAHEYVMPPNGAVVIPAEQMVRDGAHLKHTPHDLEPVLGPAHHSVFGATRTPSKTERSSMRETLVAGSFWIAEPPVPAATGTL